MARFAQPSHPRLRSALLARVSKDAGPSVASWLETAQGRLLTMRGLASEKVRLATERAVAVAEQIKPARGADFGLLSGQRWRRRSDGERRSLAPQLLDRRRDRLASLARLEQRAEDRLRLRGGGLR